MKTSPRITVAPNGARLQKADHAAVPMTAQELAEVARACQIAGANAIHLHVRELDGTHSLDPDLYRAAIDAVSKAAVGMAIQVTTEAGGRYEVSEQLHLLRDLKPAAASIAVREIARAPELAAEIYATAHQHGIEVQHILYGTSCFDQLADWMATDIVPSTMRDAILVLGQYTPPRAGNPAELPALLEYARDAGLRMTVCAFGPNEQACLLAAAALGSDLRVGFENNRSAPDGSIWGDNAQAVASLRAAHSWEVTA